MRVINIITIASVIATILLTSCKTSAPYTQPTGPATGFTKSTIKHQDGFFQHRRALLKQQGISRKDYIRLTTDSAWHLSPTDNQRLRTLRNSIPKPDSTTLFQKVFAIEKLPNFEQNNEKGVLSGFVAVAADVKKLRTSSDIFYGLRLDYEGTKFTPQIPQYAVARFYSNQTDHLRIPYCKEMGGKDEHSWPCGGGGFTTSTLGNGGFPEWVFDVAINPLEGSEIYVVTRDGKETLVLIYKSGKWVKP